MNEKGKLSLRAMNFLQGETRIAVVLFFVCLIVFYSSINYGFAHDDFERLLLHNWDQLWDYWKGLNFHWPIDGLFYFFFYKFFGYNALPFKLFLFSLYFLNSLLVYLLVRSLTRNKVMGVVIAILFAANTVQFKNIYWIACNIQLFTTTFYLLASLFFIRYLEDSRKRTLLISFGLALFGLLTTKEDLITFPLVALLLSTSHIISRKGTLSREDLLNALRPTSLLWLIPFLFLGLKSMMYLISGGSEGCKYTLMGCFKSGSGEFEASFFGIHILENFARQLFWNFGSLGIYWIDKPLNINSGAFEIRLLGRSEYFLLVSYLVGLVVLYWNFRKTTSWWYLVIGFVWFVGTLSPTLVLLRHIFPYYSAFPAIGLFIAFIMPIRPLFNQWDSKAIRIGIILFAILYLSNSLYWFYANEKINYITWDSVFSRELEVNLKRMYPEIPAGTNLVFINISRGVYWACDKMPKAMYNDLSINVYCKEDFVKKDAKFYSKEDINLNPANTHVFFKMSQRLREITPQFLKVYQGQFSGNKTF